MTGVQAVGLEGKKRKLSQAGKGFSAPPIACAGAWSTKSVQMSTWSMAGQAWQQGSETVMSLGAFFVSVGKSGIMPALLV